MEVPLTAHTDRADTETATVGQANAEQANIDPQLLALAMGEFNERIGMRFVHISPERIVATVPVEGNRQPYGLIHGGVNAAIAETLGSIAAVLNAGPGGLAVGVELNCTHHRSARSGLVTGTCVPVHVGRTVSTFETVITDEQGRRTCTARLTCFAVPRVPGSDQPGEHKPE